MDTSHCCAKCGADNTRDSNLCLSCEDKAYRPYARRQCVCGRPFMQPSHEEPVQFCDPCWQKVNFAQFMRIKFAGSAPRQDAAPSIAA